MINVYCSKCKKEVPAESITGTELYGKFSRFAKQTYFRCPVCGSYSMANSHYNPIGVLQDEELRKAVNYIKMSWDPLISQRKLPKTQLIKLISVKMKKEINDFNPENISTLEEARSYYRAITQIRKDLKK